MVLATSAAPPFLFLTYRLAASSFRRCRPGHRAQRQSAERAVWPVHLGRRNSFCSSSSPRCTCVTCSASVQVPVPSAQSRAQCCARVLRVAENSFLPVRASPPVPSVVRRKHKFSSRVVYLCSASALQSQSHMCIARLAGGGRGKEEPLSVIAMVLQAAPGDDDLPPPGPPRHTSAAQCLTTRTREASPRAGYPAHGS